MQNRIKELRERKGLRRVDVAAHCRVTEATVARWELSKTAIPDSRKFALAGLFEVSLPHLMGWDEVAA